MNSSDDMGQSRRRAGRGLYFFLSYAHSAYALQHRNTHSSDPSVRTFFRDLVEAVEHRIVPPAGVRSGFLDQDVPPGSDWDAALADALGAAEVFVPLYSPSYFNNSWPMLEHKTFLGRLSDVDARLAEECLVPVLWIPFPPWESPTEVRRAVAIGGDVPEYLENGLRALCMLAYYHEQYREIVGRIADRIVRTVRQPSSLAPRSSLVLERVEPPETVPAFVAAVLAPVRNHVESDHRPGVYGATSKAWRPFAGEQVLPAADYVASTAERLGLPTKVADFTEAEEFFNACPAVLLIDPMMLEAENGEVTLLAAVKGLPPWVRPLVVPSIAAADVTRAERLADEVVTMLTRAGVANPERVGQLQEFVDIMPTLVTEARRQYLKHGPVSPPPGSPGMRFRLTGPDTSSTTQTGTINND